MTRLTASPLLIALMQTATALPVFLVGFPAGALADIVNRRRLLLATQGLILVAAATLSVLTFTGIMNAPLLLGFTFVLGLGVILANPAWQAVNAELVPPDELPAAITLSSVSYNLARAVGPATLAHFTWAVRPHRHTTYRRACKLAQCSRESGIGEWLHCPHQKSYPEVCRSTSHPSRKLFVLAGRVIKA